MSKQYEYILVSERDGLGFIELNRPKVLNAINRPMVSELVNAFEDFDRNENVKVIVLSGKGRAFAAGADIDEMAEDGAIDLELLNQFTEWDRLAWIKKPIIGAVQGFALGGGFELALCCDMLFAAEDASFGFPEVNLGVMPGAGGTQRLTKLMGKSRAMEWLLSGDMFTASQALEWGVINRTIPERIINRRNREICEEISRPSLHSPCV